MEEGNSHKVVFTPQEWLNAESTPQFILVVRDPLDLDIRDTQKHKGVHYPEDVELNLSGLTQYVRDLNAGKREPEYWYESATPDREEYVSLWTGCWDHTA